MRERSRALTEAADYAEFYANERLTLAGDSILHDPLLNGSPLSAEGLVKSRDCQIEGTINSAAYHAAMDVARHLRELAAQ